MRERVERIWLRDLMYEAACGEDIEKIGLVGAHRDPACLS
jgi:hypothetical protein